MLNAKQEMFVLEYARTGDSVKSYQKAYKNKNIKSVYTNANRLLKKPEVQERLQEIAKQIESEKIANIKEVQERLTQIIRGELLEEVVVTEMDGCGGSDARTIQKQPSAKDIISACDRLAKMQGAYNQDLNVSVAIPVFSDEDKLED